MNFKHITDTNWLPFLLIGLMGFFWWIDAGRRNDKIEQAQVDAALAITAVNEDLRVVRDNMRRETEIRKISEQPKGRYEITITGSAN